MTLPEGFQINQGNLQDYLDCQRRFQLRYLLQVSWPSLVSQPASESENFLQLGTTFHYLVRQHLSGVPLELLTASVHETQPEEGSELITWWENYITALQNTKDLGFLQNTISPQETYRFPEVTLTTPLAGYRAVAKYDLVILAPTGKAIILDWKTNRKRPRRRWLQERIQSRIYPFILIKAGKEINRGIPIRPECVEMRFWFANYPDQPEHILYSTEQYLADEAYLRDLIQQIDQKGDAEFPLTHNIDRCIYCVYRSLCDRGTHAGLFETSESQTLEEVNETMISDFQHIDEIEF